MLESEATVSNKELQREKIRERYKGSNSELLEVIPGKKAADYCDDIERRVAVYVRVSTDNLQQTSSYELQKNYYEEKVSKNPYWTFVGIYADEGISGTSLQHRDSFNRMIEDCKAGKIDMIITKSVSRFARNIEEQTGENDDAGAGSDPAQHPGRNGGRCGLRGISDRKYQDHSDGSTGTFHRYRDPELSGGSDYFHAASRGRYEEIQSIRGRNVIRHRGADQCGDHDPGGRSDRSGAALSAQFCSGSDDLRGCGRTDPGDVHRRTFEHRNPVFRGWLLPDDDSGCGTWIKKYKRVVNEKIYHQWKPKAE